MFRILLLVAAVSAGAEFQDWIDVEEPDTSCLKRPCDLNNIPCIRREFAKKGLCNKEKTYELKDGKLTVKNMTVELAYFNATVQQNAVFKGFRCGKVAEFYFNEENDLTVFSVKFNNVIVDGTVIINYHQNLQEDVILRHHTLELYPSVTTTTIIPSGKTFKDNLQTRAYVSQPPTYDIGNIDDIENPTIRYFYDDIMLKPEVVSAALHILRAPIAVQTFIDNVICGC